MDESLAEYNHFSTFKNLQINALLNGTSETDMVTNNLTAITQIADAGNYYASAQAQNLLNDVNGASYWPETILPDEGQQQSLIAPPSNGEIGISDGVAVATLKAVPNPASKMTSFWYVIKGPYNKAVLQVKSLEGRTIWESALKGEKGQVRWGLEGVGNGVYFYSLHLDGKTVRTEKLIIIE